MYSIKNNKIQNGYTLLFSVLVATLVLGVAVFILSVSTKQYQLSIAARDSMYAVYAADAGIECGIVALDAGVLNPSLGSASITCNGGVSSAASIANYPSGDSKFDDMDFKSGENVDQYADMIVQLPDDSCVYISVTYGTDINNSPKTIIDSRGYNICPGTLSGKNRIVERQLRLIRQQ